jgi:uncharacterized membrane protein
VHLQGLAVVQLALCLGSPAVALRATRRSKVLERVGPVVLCYAFGITLGNLPGVALERGVSLQVSELAVPLAIPLLLFSTELSAWLKLARPLVVSFALACAAAVLAACTVGLLFRGTPTSGGRSPACWSECTWAPPPT